MHFFYNLFCFKFSIVKEHYNIFEFHTNTQKGLQCSCCPVLSNGMSELSYVATLLLCEQ